MAAASLAGGCDGTTNRPLKAPGQAVITGGGGAGATSNGAATNDAGGGGATDGPACWTSPVPPVTPLRPRSTIQQECGIAKDPTTTWMYPQGVVAASDDRARIVGRWVACGGIDFLGGTTAGVEFGANGRWRLLSNNPDGSLVPCTTVVNATGYYYLLASGQIDITGDGPATWGRSFVIDFAAGADALRFPAGAGFVTYARTAASPSNGADNPPTISDGRCTMLGTWDLPAEFGMLAAPAAWIAFDGVGNFTAAPIASECAGYTMYGSYQLSPGWFQITANVGMGTCDWSQSAGYEASFDASCTHLTLVQALDNCSGGRGYLSGTTTLTRRP
jgi:hypothetical protein